MVKLTTELVKVEDTWTLQFFGAANRPLSQATWSTDILDEAIAAQVQALVIDMTTATDIDSQGLKLLLDIQKDFGQNDIQVILRNPNAHLRRLFRIMQFDRIFEIEETAYS